LFGTTSAETILRYSGAPLSSNPLMPLPVF
jgi:hypothetical protein